MTNNSKRKADGLKKMLKPAFLATIPVMTGYLVLGFGFGIILNANNFSVLLALAMSAFIYAGSMQYVAISLLSGGASMITIALTTLMVNARHLFYGISMLDKYRGAGKRKPYLIFALTDETYSLVCHDNESISEENRHDYYFLVSLFNHIYWIIGSAVGAIVGELISFNSRGIDFALTALFVTVFVEQWLSNKKHFPAIVGITATALCLIIFGSESFLIPSMLIIALMLCLYKGESKNE